MPTGFSLSGSGLKWFAMLTMLLDHIGAILLVPRLASPTAAAVYLVLRCIGRMSFPIYCFLLAEGVRHTSHPRRYALRLLGFALLSEPAFNYATLGRWRDAGHANNVLFTPLLGFLALQIMRALQARFGQTAPAALVLGGAAAAALAFLAEFLGTDYGAVGVVTVVLFYVLPSHFSKRNVSFAAALLPLSMTGFLEIFALPDVFLLDAYTGQRGRQNTAQPAGLFFISGAESINGTCTHRSTHQRTHHCTHPTR